MKAQNAGVYFLITLVICGALFMSQSELPGGGAVTTLTSTQVAYGSGTNGVTSEAAFTYDATNNRLTIDNIRLSAGTVGAPSLHFGSATTGIWANGADTISFTVSGTERLRFQSNEIIPGSTNTVDLGASTNRWRNMYTMGLNIGSSGATIASSYSGTATLDFADRAGVFGCEELSVTCTGAATTNTPDCIAGSSSTIPDGSLTCRVSATNTCQAKYCGTGNPASQTIRVSSVGY